MKSTFRIMAACFAILLATAVYTAPAQAADTYNLDQAHAGFNFAIRHANISWTYGRFNKFEGKVSLDEADMTRSTFDVRVVVDSIDTNQAQRDAHLKSPDFFSEKQFPAITFKSTKVVENGKSLDVTGDFTMHGVTKSITLTLEYGGKVEMPEGVMRVGFSTEATIKRSDFGMDKFLQVVGDEVKLAISFEAIKQ